MSKIIPKSFLFYTIFLCFTLLLTACQKNSEPKTFGQENGAVRFEQKEYPLHRQIRSTVFWVGEEASLENKYIANAASAWDRDWQKHYGGIDDPQARDGFYPQGFVPQENPFYVALPYNDLDAKGKRRSEAAEMIPWAQEKEWSPQESMCKNRWVKIQKGERTAFAQWEDVGPFETNDAAYVFGQAQPRNQINQQAGVDVSPAVRDFLDLADIDTVDWQFINFKDVPAGPWREIVTFQQINW